MDGPGTTFNGGRPRATKGGGIGRLVYPEGRRGAVRNHKRFREKSAGLSYEPLLWVHMHLQIIQHPIHLLDSLAQLMSCRSRVTVAGVQRTN